jgi:hypothetical protein
MRVRRGEYARLEAAGWTVTVNSPGQWLLAALVHRRWSR